LKKMNKNKYEVIIECSRNGGILPKAFLQPEISLQEEPATP